MKAAASPALDTEALARWLQAHTGRPAPLAFSSLFFEATARTIKAALRRAARLTLAAPGGHPAEARPTARGAESAALAGVLSALGGQRIAGLEVYAYYAQPVLQLSELQNFTQLASLTAIGCKLEGSPAALSKLTALRDLSLAGCGLTHIPRSVAALSGLTYLDLDGNGELGGLGSLRRVLPCLTALQSLELSRCHLQEVPEALTALGSLTYVDFTFNALSLESLDAVLPPLSALRFLQL